MKKYLFVLVLIGVLVLPGIVLGGDLQTMVDKVRDEIYKVALAIVVIGWVITGVLFLTAAGNPEKLGKGKKALIYCVIGTALIVLAKSAEVIIKDALGVK